MMITRKSILDARPCPDYPEGRVYELVPEDGVTPRQVAESDLPIKDRHWVLVHAAGASDRILREHACWCARYALANVDNPDPRSVKAIEVAERYARGEATKDELDEAEEEAWAARAACAAANAAARAAANAVECAACAAREARAAANAAANAVAYSAANAAECAAADAAAYETIIKDLLERLEGEK